MERHISYHQQKRWRYAGLGQELRLQFPFLIVVALYVAGVAIIAQIYGLEELFRIALYSTMMRTPAILTVPMVLLTYALYLGLVEKEPYPLRRLKRDLTQNILTIGGIVGIATPLLVIPYMISAFTSFKSMIPLIRPFHWDAPLEKLDAFLHLGTAPWKITHFIFGNVYSTLTINFLYNIWIFLIWGFLLFQIYGLFGKHHRSHYILSFSLCWIVIGSFFALILSSAGPVYYGHITGLEDVYAPLMERLQAMDAQIRTDGGFWEIWALDVQDRLWLNYQNAATTVGSGISAMPSMHVSIATLMALSARRIGLWFGRLMTGYAFLIMIGSVHLGWHYALDGYLALFLTIFLWKLADRIIHWAETARLPSPRRTAPPDQARG